MAQVKGTAVQSSMRYVRERFGEEALEKVLAALPGSDRARLASIFASSWCPMPARTLELAGAKGLTSAHSLRVHRGDAVCRFEGSWD